jgi:hypothetical protein
LTPASTRETADVSITRAVWIPETRLYRREITGKYAIKILIKDEQT